MFRLIAVVLLAFQSVASAWGGEGHQVVALIAEERLSDAAKSGIHELLGDDVNISDAEVANWADQVRRERRESAPWHYVNMPLDATRYDPRRDGVDNIISAIDWQLQTLRDKSKPAEKRAEALKFVVHFVGDVHQPLHTTHRNNDKGGNGCAVYFRNAEKPTNLHRVWDTDLLRRYVGRMRIADFSLALNERISADDAKAWATGNSEAWAVESVGIARESVYPGIAAEGEPTRIGDDYVERSRPVVERQLQRAGVRLAVVLNEAFK